LWRDGDTNLSNKITWSWGRILIRSKLFSGLNMAADARLRRCIYTQKSCRYYDVEGEFMRSSLALSVMTRPTKSLLMNGRIRYGFICKSLIEISDFFGQPFFQILSKIIQFVLTRYKRPGSVN
jgi:hypothetical protein